MVRECTAFHGSAEEQRNGVAMSWGGVKNLWRRGPLPGADMLGIEARSNTGMA